MKVLFLFGPNLGVARHARPGALRVADAREIMDGSASARRCLGHETEWRQTDHEGELVGWLARRRRGWFGAVVVNPGALTHYSYALRDAVEACPLPVLEVHMTNIYAREEFRRHSVIAPACRVTIAGAGAGGYHLALEALPWITG